jgi:hypothetical protein
MPGGKAAKQHGRRHKASTQTSAQEAQPTTQVRNQEITQLSAKGKSKQRRSKRKVQGRKRAESIQASCMYLVGPPHTEEKEVKREPRIVKYKLAACAPVVQTEGARAHDVQAFQALIKSGKTTWATTCHHKARVTQPEPEAEPASGHRARAQLALERQSYANASPAIDGGESNSTRQEDVERKYEDTASESTSAASDDDELELEPQLIGLRTGSFWRRETPRRAAGAAPINTPVDGTPTRDASGVSNNQACDDSESDGPRSRSSTQKDELGDGGTPASHKEEEEEKKTWSSDAAEWWSACAMLEASTGIFTQMSLPASVESATDVAGLLDRVATEGDGGSVSAWLQGSIASVIGWFSLGL